MSGCDGGAAYLRGMSLSRLVGLIALMFMAVPLGVAQAQEEGDENPIPRLYQLLHDEHFTEPMGELGQRVRIWVWLDWMAFDDSQLRRLQRLGERFQTQTAQMHAEMDVLVAEYEAQLVPRYEEIYALLKRGDATTEELDAAAQRLEVSALSAKRDEALRQIRVATLRQILSDEKEFLYTLSPDQEQRFVSSLFFLRTTLDPFTNPATYRSIIGPTWNAGDFTSLLRSKKDDVHLNIGGLWGIRPDAVDNPNYAHIKRSVVLFFVLKEPMLAPTIEEMLQTRAAARTSP